MPFEGDIAFEIRGDFGSRQSFTSVIAPLIDHGSRLSYRGQRNEMAKTYRGRSFLGGSCCGVWQARHSAAPFAAAFCIPVLLGYLTQPRRATPSRIPMNAQTFQLASEFHHFAEAGRAHGDVLNNSVCDVQRLPR